MEKDTVKRVAVVLLSLSAGGVIGIGANEGMRTVAYKDEGGVWTIGRGHTKGVKPGDRITWAEGEAIFRDDLKIYEAGVRKAVTVPLHQYEFDAYVDQSYNTGFGAFSSSTIVKMLNQKKYLEACDHIFDWLYVKGQFSKGIFNRRLRTYKECTGLNKHYVEWSGK